MISPPLDFDALTEMFNIASGRAAAALSQMLGRRVAMTVIDLHILHRERIPGFLKSEIGVIGTALIQEFHNGMQGQASLLLSQKNAALLVRALLRIDRELDSLSAAEQSALTEIGNVVLNACVAILADQAHTRVHYQLPRLLFNIPAEEMAELLTSPWQKNTVGMLFVSRFTIGEISFQAKIILAASLTNETLDHLLVNLTGE